MRSIAPFLKKYFTVSLSILGSLWTIYEIFDYFFEDEISNWIKLALLAVSVILGPFLVFLVENYFFSCAIGEKGRIRIKLGNILRKKDGIILISINDDICSRDRRSKTGSLHSQLLYGRHEHIVREQLEKERQNFLYHKAPMGHHFRVLTPRQEFLFLVAAKLNDYGVSESTPDILRTALCSLFANQASLQTDRHLMYMPVIGTGSAGVNLSHEEAIKLIAKQFIVCCAQKDENSPNRIHTLEIVIRRSDRKKIQNWSKTCDDIRAMAQLCGECQNTSH